MDYLIGLGAISLTLTTDTDLYVQFEELENCWTDFLSAQFNLPNITILWMRLYRNQFSKTANFQGSSW